MSFEVTRFLEPNQRDVQYKYCEAPVVWSRVPETTLHLRQLYRTFIWENVVPAGRVIFITLIEYSNLLLSLFLRVSPGHSMTVGCPD